MVERNSSKIYWDINRIIFQVGKEEVVIIVQSTLLELAFKKVLALEKYNLTELFDEEKTIVHGSF